MKAAASFRKEWRRFRWQPSSRSPAVSCRRVYRAAASVEIPVDGFGTCVHLRVVLARVLGVRMKFKIVALQVFAAALLGALCGTATSAEGAAATPVVVDVRTAEEFAQNHLVGAVNLDFKAADFPEQVQKLDRSGSYRLYCRTGNRSAQAAELMKKLGFSDVQSVGGLPEAAVKLQLSCTAKQGC